MYCNYCGSSYHKYICSKCDIEFSTCDCESGYLCEACAEEEDSMLANEYTKNQEEYNAANKS